MLTVSHSLPYFVLTVTCRGGQGKCGSAGFMGKFKSCLMFPNWYGAMLRLGLECSGFKSALSLFHGNTFPSPAWLDVFDCSRGFPCSTLRSSSSYQDLPTFRENFRCFAKVIQVKRGIFRKNILEKQQKSLIIPLVKYNYFKVLYIYPSSLFSCILFFWWKRILFKKRLYNTSTLQTAV